MNTFKTYAMGGFAGTHEIAEALYYIATGHDISAEMVAHVIQNSSTDLDDLTAYIGALADSNDLEDKAQYAALSRPRPIDESEIEWRQQQAAKWHDAIKRAALEWHWPRFDLDTLAPLSPEDCSPAVVSVQLVINWLRDSGASPAFANGLAAILDTVREKHGDTGISDPGPALQTHQELDGSTSTPDGGLRELVDVVQKRYWGDNWDKDDPNSKSTQADIVNWLLSTYPQLSKLQAQSVERVACPIDRNPAKKA
jgi:hypothetical protein